MNDIKKQQDISDEQSDKWRKEGASVPFIWLFWKNFISFSWLCAKTLCLFTWGSTDLHTQCAFNGFVLKRRSLVVTATQRGKKNVWEHEWSAKGGCVSLQMEMKLTKMPHLFFFFFFKFRFCLLYKSCVKNSLTYFGDSGVKGSGKMVGLAAEHKGAWVINLLVHTVPKIFQVHIYN